MSFHAFFFRLHKRHMREHFETKRILQMLVSGTTASEREKCDKIPFSQLHCNHFFLFTKRRFEKEENMYQIPSNVPFNEVKLCCYIVDCEPSLGNHSWSSLVKFCPKKSDYQLGYHNRNNRLWATKFSSIHHETQLGDDMQRWPEWWITFRLQPRNKKMTDGVWKWFFFSRLTSFSLAHDAARRQNEASSSLINSISHSFNAGPNNFSPSDEAHTKQNRNDYKAQCSSAEYLLSMIST